MAQVVPITLSAIPVPVGIQAANINQLLQIIAQYMSAQIAQNVSFYAEGASVPGAFVTNNFFNTATGTWYYWDTGVGAYVAVTEFEPGDIKNSFVAGDNIEKGWVVCDGRKISAIQGISTTQASVLQQLFGISGSLPTVTPVQNLSGLPQTGAFSNISVPAILPPTGQFANLTFGASYNPSDSQTFATNAEALDDSTQSLQGAVVAIQGVAETLLEALIGAGPKLYASVFCGFP